MHQFCMQACGVRLMMLPAHKADMPALLFCPLKAQQLARSKHASHWFLGNASLSTHDSDEHCMQVSPHEFMQQVMAASSKRFTIEKKSDPVEFLSWLLNTIHSDLTSGKRKKPSIISKCFQVMFTSIFSFTV